MKEKRRRKEKKSNVGKNMENPGKERGSTDGQE